MNQMETSKANEMAIGGHVGIISPQYQIPPLLNVPIVAYYKVHIGKVQFQGMGALMLECWDYGSVFFCSF